MKPCIGVILLAAMASISPAAVVTLDGDQWRLATDPRNVGREEKWFEAPRTNAVGTRVPWIIQDAFPGYHGVAWYWREFNAPTNSHVGGRFLLRFWAVDYLAEVWLNGVRVGGHEGGETPFVLDVTDTLRVGANNLLAVRVLNPTHERIDGLVLNETPKQARAIPYRAGEQAALALFEQLVAHEMAHVQEILLTGEAVQLSLRVTASEHDDRAGEGRRSSRSPA